MNLRKSSFIFQIIFYFLFNIYFLESIQASKSINNEISQNNPVEKLKSPILKEDLYVLGVGDRLFFNVIGIEDLKTDIKILNDGYGIIPLLGPVKLKGHTISSASKYIETLLKQELINPKVELFIYENRPVKISIIGEISRPGIYKLKTTTVDFPTVITAIEEAGGISKFADLTKITLQRQLPGDGRSYKKTNLNFRNLIFKGDQSQNPFLFDGDIIEIQKVKNLDKDFLPKTSTSLSPKFITVNFIGEVVKPGSIKLDADTTLIDGILAAGGPKNYRSNYTNVEILRIDRNGSAFRKRYKFDLTQDYSEKNNPVLNNGDSIWLRRNNFAKASDALGIVIKPFRDLINIWTLIEIVD